MWGSDVVVAHGEVFKPADLPGFLAEVDSEPVGVAHVNVVPRHARSSRSEA